MIGFMKSVSCRRVGNEYYNDIHDENDDDDNNKGSYEGNAGPCTIFTVWRKSLLVSCSGFTVINCKGDLVFRVDNYNAHPCDIVLMDGSGSGSSVFTMRRHKTLRLIDDWVIYNGEAKAIDQNNKTNHEKQSIIGYIKKNVTLLHANSNVVAHVFMGHSCKKPTYVIEGSYGQRSCKIFDKSSKKNVAEIRRKEAINGCVSFGLDVFHLVVTPGFDTGFAMAMVLVLDQMY